MIRGRESFVADDDMHDIRPMSRSLNLANGFRDISSLIFFSSFKLLLQYYNQRLMLIRKPRTCLLYFE